MERSPDLAGTILDKGASDHMPILLKEAKADYGPVPFIFSHSRLDCDGFDDLVENSRPVPYVGDSNPIVVVKKKLKIVKNIIKTWNFEKRKKRNKKRIGIYSKKSMMSSPKQKLVMLLLMSWRLGVVMLKN